MCAATKRYDEALSLLKASRSTLCDRMGREYPAAAEAGFYIALAHASNPFLEAERDEIFNELEKAGSMYLCGILVQFGCPCCSSNVCKQDGMQLPAVGGSCAGCIS